MRKVRFRKPMLAKDFESNTGKVALPCFLQPKLDGIRCVTDGQRFWSRNGKLFPAVNLRHLQTKVAWPYLIDGELKAEGIHDFEDTVSGVKNASTPNKKLAKSLRLHVFDVMTDEPFEDRTITTRNAVEEAHRQGAHWKFVATVEIRSVSQLERWHKMNLDRGHEGSIVRNAKAKYEHKRTHHLLKWKPLQSDEFEIIGIVEAKGKDRGTPIFVCAVPGSDEMFRVRPMGTMKQRRKMWHRRGVLIGKDITVEYQNLTKRGKPRFPRAKVLRDYE